VVPLELLQTWPPASMPCCSALYKIQDHQKLSLRPLETLPKLSVRLPFFIPNQLLLLIHIIAGYGGVYNATPPPQFAASNVLGGARGPPPQQILPVDLPPQAFLTSAMLLDMVDSTNTYHIKSPRGI